LVRALLLLFLVTLPLFAVHPLIEDRLESLLEPEDLKKHAKLIKLVFANENKFISHDKADSIAIIRTLKANGLLKLFFKKPQKLNVRFVTGGNAQFFIKLMRDSLRSIGYYRFFTSKSRNDNHAFSWEIEFISEYAIDPIVLQKALAKRNCVITAIERKDAKTWNYSIDITNAHLSLTTIIPNREKILQKSLREYWVDVSLGKKLTIHTLRGDKWFPDIAIFDKKMRLLKVYKRKRQTTEVVFYLPKESTYLKISDYFNQSNIRHGLSLLLQGEK